MKINSAVKHSELLLIVAAVRDRLALDTHITCTVVILHCNIHAWHRNATNTQKITVLITLTYSHKVGYCQGLS